MTTSTKKKLKIILPIVLAVVVIVGGTLTYFAWSASRQKPAGVDSGISLDQTPSYGACQLVTSNTIKQTFGGDQIVQLNEGVRIGEKEMNDTIGEGCRFAFSTSKSNNNSLTTSVYDYTTSDKEAVTSDWSEVGGSTPVAYFGKTTENGGQTTVFMYRILPGSKNILIALRQPTSKLTYDEEAAFNFIGGIASKANIDVIKDKTTPTEETNTTPGAVTDNP